MKEKRGDTKRQAWRTAPVVSQIVTEYLIRPFPEGGESFYPHSMFHVPSFPGIRNITKISENPRVETEKHKFFPFKSKYVGVFIVADLY